MNNLVVAVVGPLTAAVISAPFAIGMKSPSRYLRIFNGAQIVAAMCAIAIGAYDVGYAHGANSDGEGFPYQAIWVVYGLIGYVLALQAFAIYLKHEIDSSDE